MPNKSDNLVQLVTAALSGVEEQIASHVAAQLNARIKRVGEKLQENGRDATKAFPYPKSTMSREAYIRCLNDYEFCRRFYKSIPGQRNFGINDPDLKVLREDADQRVTSDAAAYAKDATRAFIAKLAGKMAKHLEGHPELGEVTACTHTGNMWDGSTVIFTTKGGDVRWHTQTIINVSVLGKLFNQFPTRLVK